MDLTGDAKFLFMTMMQAAIKMKKLGKTKKDYVDFASEIWETLLMNDTDNLESILLSAMIKDLKDF